jgi:imidazole glycerol-phosphate synthase subunit HisH
MICIVDYGTGNLASIKNMFKHIGIRDVIISSDTDTILRSEKIILPGVGAFDNGMTYLHKYDLIETLNYKALDEKVPFLGICLGMQLMTHGSEEGRLPGLGWFNAQTYKFDKMDDLKIPHMGWNYIKSTDGHNYFLTNGKKYRFYFVHSYYVKCKSLNEVMFTTTYGNEFHSAIQKDNIYGMQFHPEKSLHFGMDILNQFSKL